jgi:hypothetical protein
LTDSPAYWDDADPSSVRLRLVLGFDLIVVSLSLRWIGPALTGLAALLFLAYGAHSILTLAGQPSGTPKKTARKSSFMI